MKTITAAWLQRPHLLDPSLPLNQLNVYDGLESVPDTITIELNNLNVMDTNGARIGLIAWGGDAGLAVDEELQMNGITLSNPPLNPVNNAFNGTNSFTRPYTSSFDLAEPCVFDKQVKRYCP